MLRTLTSGIDAIEAQGTVEPGQSRADGGSFRELDDLS
jgi:hypothetical protein